MKEEWTRSLMTYPVGGWCSRTALDVASGAGTTTSYVWFESTGGKDGALSVVLVAVTVAASPAL